MTCPICGGAARVPPLDALALRLIDGRGLSENAEAFLRLFWQGEIVKSSALLAVLYDDAPDDEPSANRLYQEAWAALADLRAALAAEGSGVTVVEVGWRQGWRIRFPAAMLY
jgi:hypothetical protein